MDRNQHVREYLTYYLGFQTPPNFAVLLDGTWGIGKTFFIKDFMTQFEGGGLRRAYVSLYGLSSFEEIDKAVLRAIYPLLDKRTVAR